MKQLVIRDEKWIFQSSTDINSLMTINYLNKKSFPVDHHSPTRNFPIKKKGFPTFPTKVSAGMLGSIFLMLAGQGLCPWGMTG